MSDPQQNDVDVAAAISRRQALTGLGIGAAALAGVGLGPRAASSASDQLAGWRPLDEVVIGGLAFRVGQQVQVLLPDGVRRMSTVTETSRKAGWPRGSLLVELEFTGGAPPQQTVSLQTRDGLSSSLLLVPNGPSIASVIVEEPAHVQ